MDDLKCRDTDRQILAPMSDGRDGAMLFGALGLVLAKSQELAAGIYAKVQIISLG